MDKKDWENMLSNIFEGFINKSEDVYWVRSPDYKEQLFVSKAYEALWGRSCDSLYNNPDTWQETLHPDDRERLLHSAAKRDLATPATEKFYEYYRLIRSDGSIRWVRDYSFPLTDADGNIYAFAGIAQDITETKEYEAALKEAKENAEAANHAKSDFLAMMSHELRTPLNEVMGLTQLLLEKEMNRDDQREMLEDIYNSGNDLLRLISDILDFVRADAGQLQISPHGFYIEELANELYKEYSWRAHEKNLELIVEQTQLSQRISADIFRLKQILGNLITNAIKFTDKGHIKLIISQQPGPEDKLITIKFTVEDTGIGISPEHQKAIFEKFQQINPDAGKAFTRKHGGVGLGLSIVKLFVEQMEGLLEVQSQAGIGTQFSCTFTLPVLDAPNATGNTTTFKARQPQPLKQSVNIKPGTTALVVEDNPLNQKVIKLFLEDFGCTVDVASNGTEALEKMAKPYHIIFMDISLPDMSGLEVTKRFRAEHPDNSATIVALTAHALKADREVCLDAGMNDYLVKPLVLKELCGILNKWL
ncbi:MAG: hypothetical protein CMF50_10425 [Legionellales bacterium]|nr:hypothetical protein [Legionellales bacterium]